MRNLAANIKPREILDQMKPYVPGKPIWEVQAAYGLDRVVKLASNENPLGPAPKALAAIADMLPHIHRYPDDRSSRLVQALAERYLLDPGQFIVSNGADELITLLSEAFLGSGDEVVIPSPSFSEYEFGGLLMEAVLVPVPLRDGFAYCVNDILAAITSRTKLIYLCSPNNPTGTYLARDELVRLMEELPKSILVVLDAAYSHYADASDYTDGFEMVKKGYPLIVLQTFSKIYGLAGLRVGFAAAPADVVKAMLCVKEPFNVNALAQAAALAALNDSEHLARSIAVNTAGRHQLSEGLRSLGIEVQPSQSNFLLVPIGPDAASIQEALVRSGVIVRGGAGWGLSDYLRISVGSEEENSFLLASLEAAMHSRG